MQGGDIDNIPSPKLVFLFEGLLGVPTTASGLLEKTRQWKRAARAYKLNEQMAHQCMDLIFRRSYGLAVVTFKPDEFAEEVVDILDEAGLPFGYVEATSAGRLARELAYSPDVARVFFADPALSLTFGSRAFLVRDGGHGVDLLG